MVRWGFVPSVLTRWVKGWKFCVNILRPASCSINAEFTYAGSGMVAEFLHTGPMRKHLKAMTENLAVVVSNFLVTAAGRSDLELRWCFPYSVPQETALYHAELPGTFTFDGPKLSVFIPLELGKQISLLRDKHLHLDHTGSMRRGVARSPAKSRLCLRDQPGEFLVDKTAR